MKLKEIVYMVLDLAKSATSDDSFYTEEHVIFLVKKFRSFLIKKEQEKEKTSTDIASEFEYQQICLDLEMVPAIDGDPCTGGYYLRTVQEIPKILEGTQPRVYPIDYYQGDNIVYVPRDRMKYVGTNKFLRNIIYVSLGPDLHLYLNSNNPQFQYLEKLRVNAIFEDTDKAAEYACDDNGEAIADCDPLESSFPIREYLIPSLIELVVKELVGANYRPVDDKNDAKDNLTEIATASNRTRWNV